MPDPSKKLEHVLAIDPGIRCTGVAYFRYSNLERLDAFSTKAKDDLGKRVAFISKKIKETFENTIFDLVVIEYPEIYRHTKQDIDYEDILAVTLVAGAVLGSVVSKEWRLPKPKQWKGQVPKNIHNDRVLNRLYEHERGWPELSNHNAIDAVGLGLWGLGRRK